MDVSRNQTITIPIDVALFNGRAPRPGEAASLSCSVIARDTGLLLDFADGTFKATPTTPTTGVSPMAGQTNDYALTLVPSSWPRGHYRALLRHAETGEEFSYDFSLGLSVNRRLGHAGAYDGTTLRLSVWVEEEGEAQTDYTALREIRLLDHTGEVVAELGDASEPVAGVFTASAPVAIAEHGILILDALAIVPGGADALAFHLRVGLARP